MSQAEHLVIGIYIELDLEKTDVQSAFVWYVRKGRGKFAILPSKTHFFAR